MDTRREQSPILGPVERRVLEEREETYPPAVTPSHLRSWGREEVGEEERIRLVEPRGREAHPSHEEHHIPGHPEDEHWWGLDGADMFVATAETFLLVFAIMAHMLYGGEIDLDHPWRITHLALVRPIKTVSLVPLMLLYFIFKGWHCPGRNAVGQTLFFLRVLVALGVLITAVMVGNDIDHMEPVSPNNGTQH